MQGYHHKINNINAMQQLHLKYTFIVGLAPLPGQVAYILISYSSCRQRKCQRILSGACHGALTFRIMAGTDIEKFAWKVVRDICVIDAMYGSFDYITNPTLCSHRTKSSHFQLSKQDLAGSTEYIVAVKKNYNFGASYQEQMSPSGGLQKSSSRYLKKHLQLGEGMKRITTPLLLMSAGASLISMHGLQELLLQFLLSLYLSVAYSTCICLQVIAILALYACRGYKTRDIFTQAGMISHQLVSLPSYFAYDHKAPKWNDHVLLPSTPSTSFRL